MARIYSTHLLHPKAAAMLSDIAELEIASGLDAATLAREGRDADIVIVRAPLPEVLFDDAPRLRAAIRHGAGLDMIPIAAATRAGVLVANVPAVNASTVAEHVVMSALMLLRQFRRVDRDLRGKGWLAGRSHADTNQDLAGRTIGIVGMGAVGQGVLRIARDGFGLDAVANSRRLDALPPGVRGLEVDALLEASDIVVLCCPLTPETTGLVSRARIARMRPGSILVNVSRGAVIDEIALVDALREGRIGGAALDVFTNQPLTPDHPLFCFDNVILTPHMAGITEQSMMRMGTGAAAEAARVLEGRLPVNLRNPEVVPGYRARFPEA